MSSSKRILIISNEALDSSSSNGRTMMNLLKRFAPENLAQFYIHGSPDYDICKNYFKSSDINALRTFLFLKRKPEIIDSNLAKSNDQLASNVKNKNCVKRLLRNMAWMSFRWWKKDFDEFVDSFSPDVVLLQAGDAPFMYAIALKISKKYNIPIVMYNSESYVLKEYMYNGADKNRISHFFLKSSLKKQYKRIMGMVSYCIYSAEYLEREYQKKYPHKGKSCTLYTISEMPRLPDNSNETFNLLYCGNLGVGRDEPLAEIAKILYEVDPNAKLDIYGKFISKESEDLVCSNENVNNNGFVPYDEIPRIMSEASMLIHTEHPDRLENLKNAFSTKIADSLASGRPFLVYASREYPFVKYLIENDCAHIASNEEELKEILEKCISDKEYRNKYVDNALATAQKNHNIETICNKMLEIISQAHIGE